nr:MAG TPA: hypothetical protein [Caudoviricetes sp.]
MDCANLRPSKIGITMNFIPQCFFTDSNLFG